ncbi:hypothetical protein CPB83DRAFT_894628 [Crepidotus variabilis]|uniref:Uncharacterized protein n=1 Tax=Crepidotus variabilis TaxID=179855 RepID=A0A9P6EFI3_9AGAR|nr:hypothetical protein CPB83DRAFT_894628 [Crepidotus variabilis]
MESDYRGSEGISTRQPRKPLTGGFLPGLNCRRNSSSPQRFSRLLDSKPHIHFPRNYPPVTRRRRSSECLYFNEKDGERDVRDLDENYQLQQPSFRHHKRTNSPSTSSETVRVGTLRRRPSSSNLRASASSGTSNPAVLIDSVALKVRQFSATARSASGWCCVGYSNFLPTPGESFASGQCISADGTASIREKHIKRKSSTSSTSSLTKLTPAASCETLKPQRVHSGNAVTASGEDQHRNGNNSTGATASGLSSGLNASATATASQKPRCTRAKTPSSSSKKGRDRVKDREKVKSKHTEDNVTHGTGPPTYSSSSRTRTIPSTNTSKRLLSSSTRSSCVSRSSTTSPAIPNARHTGPSPGIVTHTTTGSLISATTSIPSPASASVFPPYDFFSTPSSSEFVFPSFDALDDLNRWDMELMPLSSDCPGPEIERNDISRRPHQNCSDSASCTRSPFESSSCITDSQTTTLASDSTPPYSPASLSVQRPSLAPVSSPSPTLFSTPFDDEPIEYEIPFPSMRRVLMEDTRIKKSKTLAADKARAPPYGSSLGGLTSLLMQKPRYVYPSVSSPPSSGPASTTPMSSSKSSFVNADSETTPTSTPPRSPKPSLPPLTSDSSPPLALPSRLEEGLAMYSPVVSRSQLPPSLPNGLPSPLFSLYSIQLASSNSTPEQTGYTKSLLDSRSTTPSVPSTSSNTVTSTQPPTEDANNTASRTNRRSPPVSITQPPRQPPQSPLPGIPSSSSPSSTLSVLPVNAESTSPTTNSASDSGYGSGSANMRGSGKKRSSPRSSDEEKARKNSKAYDPSRGNGRHDGKGWGYTTKTWTDPNGCVHLGAEDCVVEVLFPQVKDFEVWDMSDSGWVAVPVLLNLLAKDAKRWIGVPLAMPDVTYIDLQCEDVPLPVPFEYLSTGTTLSASSSAFYTNSYTTSFVGGKSALDESSSFGAGKGYRSSRSSGGPDKGRGMSMMEALRKKEEEQSINSDKISIEGKWVRTYNRPGVEGAQSRTSDDIREDGNGTRSTHHSPVSRSDHRRSPGLDGSKETKNVHRGWYLKFWIPVPTRLFVKRETRLFNIQAQVWMMGDEEKEEKGLKRGNTVLDRFEIGMEEVEKWLGSAEPEEDEQDALPLTAQTQMTVSHLRREREMSRSY